MQKIFLRPHRRNLQFEVRNRGKNRTFAISTLFFFDRNHFIAVNTHEKVSVTGL